MGNEASLEGGEGGLAGLPEGIVSDGKGGFIQIPAGTEADLSKLSEEERKQIAAVMSKAQTKPPGNAKDAPTQRTSEVDAIHQPRQPGKPPTQGPSGLSKSRTVDAFRTGPAARQAPPGRSPSSLSLLESLSRQEAREETRSSMFSSNFLSGANPLSAVSSAVNKFSLFGDEEPEEEKKQKAAAQQAGPAKQGQGPPQQRGPQGPQQQTAPKGGPQPQGPTKPGPQQQQGPTKPGPQQQGPAKPGPQQQGPSKPGPQGPSKPGPQGPSKPGPQGPSKPGPQQQQGPGKPGLCQQGPPSTGAQSAGPAKTGAPPSGPGVAGPKQSEGPSPGKSTCPLCKTTELTLHTKEQPNYNTCTQCKTVVCSLCGFSPPDSEGKEWLCLNCQMQRALGGMDAPAPPKMKPQPQPSKQPSAPSSPQKKQATPDTQGHKPEAAKPAEAKKPSPLKKQPTLSDTGKPGTPPSTPPSARKGPAQAPEKGTGPQEAHKPSGTQKPQDQPGPTGTKQDMTGPQSASPAPLTQAAQKPAQQPSIKPAQQQEQQPPDQKPSGGAVKTDPKAGPLTQEPHKSPQQMPKGGAGPSPAKPGAPPQAQPPPQPPKQESSFFGLSFGGFSEPPKPQPGKPPPTTPQAPESVSGKLFGFGGFSEAPKQPAAAPPAESVSGKMFGFGSSIFSSASSLITTTAQDQPPAQPPATSKEPTPAQPSPKKPPAAEGKPSAGQKPETSQQAKPTPPTPEKKTIPTKADKPPTEPPKVTEPPQPAPKEASSNCPLCKVELNVGSKDTPSYNTCTECRKTVCNLCGFNPMPHLNEKEWLCLNCQTQRALAGQLGDMPPPMPAPTKPENQQPAPTKLQTSPAKQSAPQMAEPVTTEPSPPKPAPVEQNAVNTESAAPASPAIAPKPATSSPAKEPTRLATNDHTPPQKPADMARTAEITEGAKKAEAVTRETIKEPTGETEEKADNKSEISVSSEVITDSLGETPSIIPSEKNELLKEPVKKDGDAPETSPTSPSDLAKLESTVLSILEAQKSTDKNENASNVHDQKQEQHRPKTLPISAESFSSEEGELEDAREVGKSAVKDAPIVTAQKKERKKLHVLPEGRQRYDSVEDSSESEPSPLQQRRRKISAASTSSEEYKLDSPGSGDDEDFIRKQIMEMSADEDASEDEDNYIRKQIKEEEEKREQDDKKVKCKSTSGKSKRLLKKSSVSHELEPERRHSWQESEEQECEESSDSKNRETKSQEGEAPSIDSGGGLRRFKTIELNNTTASPYNAGATVRQGTEEGELEMESLTDSPEDRSRGESSSLHASSFTPGTSPTSVSSFDEDSDSSPSHKRTSGEGKQHRKARHRQHGQVLPTIEDSSEEEEMREEEELLREQEKQREVDQQQVKKSSSKKSKKDKEELRAQRRREHPKTPPSNLSPIEDASPTEELRQAAEMEELHKSSCSEYSPSIESEPEGFEIHPDKIIAVQKVYKLPTSVSLYSPTEEQNTEMTNDMDKSLKSADEAYEEMMQNVKTLQGKKETEEQLEKEPLYGGMLIEDYIYESLVENKVTGNYVAQKKESSKISVQEPVKKLKSPDEAYEDMQRRKEIILKEQGLQQTQPVKTPSQPQQDMDLPAITCKPTYVNISTSNTAPPTKDGKPLLDAEAAYEELMKRQRVILTPGTSPTQPVPELNDMVLTPPKSGAEDNQEGGVIAEALVRNNTHDMPVSSDTSSNRALYPIPDLKITQCSSGEEDVEEEESIAQKQEKVKPTEASQAGETVMKVEQTSVASSPAPVSPSAPSPVQVTAPAVAPAPAQAAVAASTPVPVQVSAPEAAPVPISVPTEIAPPPPPPPPPLPSSVTTSPAITETPRVSAACVSSSVSTPLDLTSSPSETAQPAVLGIESMVEDLSKPRSSIHENVVSGHISNMPATVTPPLLPLVMQSAQEPVVASDMSVTNICPVTGVISLKTSIASVSAIPTVPHYAPAVSSIVSTAVSATFSTTHTHTSAPPIPPKPAVLLRGSSQEKADIDNAVPPPPPPPPPPLPPPTLPKPAVYPKKPSISTPPIMPAVASVSASTAVTVIQATITTPDSTLRNAAAPTYRPHVPPPIPPKPASIPVGLTFSHKPGESVKPPVAPKPAVVQPASQAIAMIQARPAPPPSTTAMALNLSTPVEYKPSATSPRSPLSPRYGNSLHETYVVITLPSEPGTPVEGIITQAPISPALVSPMQHIAQAAVPLAYTHYTNSVEIQGTDKVVSSMSQIYSSMSTSTQPVVPLPNLVAQVVTTEVQRTTVSVVREKIPVTPLVPATRTATEVVTVAQGTPKAQPIPKENGKIYYSGDVVDLRTLKQDAEMTDKGLDLSATDSRGHSISADASGHQTSAVQSVVVNLSTEATPLSSLSIGTDNITIVTCTATISCAGNRPLNLGHTTSMPLQLTTSRSFEPVAQIVYRPIDSQPTTNFNTEAPINLSFGAITSADTSRSPLTPASLSDHISGHLAHNEAGLASAVDLTTTKPIQTMVAVNGSNSAVVTTVVEDDGKPVDLTAGKRVVCCDVVYKLPFAGSCTTQQPTTALPEDRFGYRDDHYQYNRSGPYSMKGFGGMKSSMSDTNLAEAGLFFYKSKNSYDYQNGATEGAVDLTSGKLSTGEIMDYSSKGTGAYPSMTVPQYSQARITPVVGTHFGTNSMLRSSNGVVYSSVAAPVPSTYAITTQPGSIFSTTYNSLSGMHTSDTMPSLSSLQDHPLPRSYSFFTTTAAEQQAAVSQEIGLSKEGLSPAFTEAVPTATTMPGSYTDASLEAIAASLEALASPMVPGTDESTQQYQMEREFLELEKMKQLRLAEELEWERQEIQRFREQEQLIVQKELEELQTMKQQLLFQQEEERQAHLMMQQETYAQQQLQLEQIQQLQQQLQQQLEEQKMRQMFPYDPPTTSEQALLDAHYAGGEGSQYWPEQDQTGVPSNVAGLELQQNATWYTVPTEGVAQYISNLPESEIPLKESEGQELAIHTDRTPGQYDEHGTDALTRKIVESGVQTDEEEGADKACIGRRKRNKRSVDSSVQTDDEDQDEWDIPARSRRRSRSSKQGSKVSSIAIQTVAEISVQTDHSGTIKRPSVRAQVDTKLEIKQISAPEKTYRGGSTSCQTEVGSGKTSPQKDKRRPTPLEIGHSTHLKADSTLQVAPSPPKSPKVLYSPISPLSPSKSLEFAQYEKSVGDTIPQKMLTAESSKPPTSPRTLKAMQRSLSDPKPQSPTSEERTGSNFQYSDGYSGKGSQSSTPSGTQKKVKRTLPNPPPEEESAASQTGYSTGSARRRLCRNTTMARAKILQDIDRELDLVERESSKLRKKQAELDEEEKEIDAKLRYLEMGINRRKDALLKEREKRERAYLQGVAEERDYMSDSEVSNIRETRGNGHGLERPRTAPQSEFNQFIPPQTQPEAQYAQSGGSYTQYPYAPQTQATTQYPQQTLYQQPSLYHQQVSPYQSQSIYSSVPSLSYPQSSHQQSQQQSYQHTSQMLLMQQKARQTTLSDLEPKITTNYEVIRSQPLMMGSSSTDTSYAVPHLAGKYSSLDLRLGLEERGSMASSPMSSISADSFYADIDHHTPRNYVLIDDIGELTKSSAGLSSSFTIPDKDLAKADRLLRAAEARRSAEVTDYLGPLQASSRLHSYNKPEEDAMEEPYELKLLKQQIKQEFRRGTDSLDPLTGLPHYYPGESSYRHFPKTEKYSISRLTLEKQAAKQLPASVLYQKQAKHKKALMDPKITKFSPIQESKDLEPDYSSYLGSSVSSVSSLSSRARLLQDELTFGLRKNITEQQKYLGSTLGANLAQSLNLGQSLNLSPTLRSSLQDDTAYPSGSRSRPSSRPSSVYGLDLSLKRDLSSSSLRLKTEGDALDPSFTTPSVRTKPTSLPISQSRGRIPIVAQNSEEESPLSPVGQPMGMARASAGPLPPISADSRDQFGSSHSLPEVQQHMREESRTRGYDRDIAFMMDDLQGAMSDSEAGGSSWDTEAYHLRREETDWFDKPREARLENGHGVDRRQIKSIHYPFPHTRIKLLRDPKDHSVSGNGLGIRVVGGKDIPGNNGDIGAYIAKVLPGGAAELTGKIVEGMQVLEWNGIPLTGKTYEEVQSLVGQQCGEAELCVRLDLNMLSDSEHPQHLELHDQTKTGDKQRSPGVDPKQLAAELQKVSQQQTPSTVLSASEKGPHIHSGTASAGSSAVPSPGQPASPSVSKKRHGSKSAEAVKTQSHPVSGEIQLQINYDKNLGNLIVHVLQARNLPPRDNNGYSDPFVKVYLLPGRGAENKRRTKHAQKSLNPEWNQTVIYKNIHLEQIKKKTLEVTVWDYDRFSSNDFLGEVLIDLSNTVQLDNVPRWFPLKEQSESQERSHSSQGSQQSPKPSVIKSRSHGVFPDPSKDMQVPTIEKSHSSPGSSKSSSEGHARSHGPSRSQSKSSVTQAHLEDAGVAIAAAEAAVQQLRLQPIHKSSRTKKHHRHSIAGVLTIHRTQSDYLPAPANEMKDTSQLTIRKMMSEGTPKKDGARSGHRATDATATTTSSTSSLGSSGLTLDEEGGTNAVDSAIFQVPHIGKTIPNGTDKTRGSDPLKPSLGLGDTEAGKTQMMGEIKIALKKEMKTEGEQLIVEILQCRNITYKFKTPDHLPDLYVKLYVVNVATQKRIIKKKTRVCRHDREPSFNETFRFSMNPAGHSIQLFLVSNGGKFVKKTLIGEAYIWLDKVDLRKRSVSWHKLLASSTQANS